MRKIFILIVTLATLASCRGTRDISKPNKADQRHAFWVLRHPASAELVRKQFRADNPIIIPAPVIIKGKDSIVYAIQDSALIAQAYNTIDSLLAINCPTISNNGKDSLIEIIKKLKKSIRPDTVHTAPVTITIVDPKLISDNADLTRQLATEKGKSIQKDNQIAVKTRRNTHYLLTMIGELLFILLLLYLLVRKKIKIP